MEEGKQLAVELKNPPLFKRWLQILENFLQSGTSFSTQNLEKYKPMLEGFLPEWEKVLAYCNQPKSRKDILEKGIGLTNQTYNFKNYIEPLLEQQLLRRTIPDRPQSPQQKYFTTERGNILLHLLERVKK